MRSCEFSLRQELVTTTLCLRLFEIPIIEESRLGTWANTGVQKRFLRSSCFCKRLIRQQGLAPFELSHP